MAAFMRYFRVKEREHMQDAAFRLYVAYGVQALAKFAGANLPDYAEWAQLKPKETRNADDIINTVMKRAGLEVMDGGSV